MSDVARERLEQLAAELLVALPGLNGVPLLLFLVGTGGQIYAVSRMQAGSQTTRPAQTHTTGTRYSSNARSDVRIVSPSSSACTMSSRSKGSGW